MGDRRVVEIGPKRREWFGAGGSAPPDAERLLARARDGATCRWEGLGKRAGRSLDQVDAERILWRAVEAGLVVIRERKTRRGDWEPYQWRLTETGEASLPPRPQGPDVAGYLALADDPNHPVLSAIRAWLERASGSAAVTRIVLAIGEELRVGGFPRERLLSVRVKGCSKGIQIEEHRAELEEALGLPLDQVVRSGGRAAFVAGQIQFRVQGVVIDASGLPPWMALPPETIDKMENLRVAAKRLLTIENLIPFEEEARVGLPQDTVALWVRGFPGDLEREMVARFVAAGVETIDHWGDLDLGGLRILRYVRSFASVEVRMFRMEAALLDSMPTLPLKQTEREELAKWVADPEAPGRELAAAILEKERKAEQEAWYLRRLSGRA